MRRSLTALPIAAVLFAGWCSWLVLWAVLDVLQLVLWAVLVLRLVLWAVLDILQRPMPMPPL